MGWIGIEPRLRRWVPALLLLALPALAGCPERAQAISQKRADKIAKRLLRTELETPNSVLFRLGKASKGDLVGSGLPKKPGKRDTFKIRAKRLKRSAYLYMWDGDFGAMWEKPTTVLALDKRRGRRLFERRIDWFPVINGRQPKLVRSQKRYHSKKDRVAPKRIIPRTGAAVSSGRELRNSPKQPKVFPEDPLAGVPAAAKDRLGGALRAEGSCVMTFSNEEEGAGNDDTIAAIFKDLGVHVLRVDPKAGKAGAKKNFEAGIAELEARSCRDIFIYLHGHGQEPNAREDTSIQFAYRREGDRRAADYTLDPSAVNAALQRHPGITFKVVIDACHSGLFKRQLGGSNLIHVQASTGEKSKSYGLVEGVKVYSDGTTVLVGGDGKEVGKQPQEGTPTLAVFQNPHAGVIEWRSTTEFTYAFAHGMAEFAASDEEIDHAAANAGVFGAGRSFLAWWLSRAGKLGRPWDVGFQAGLTEPSSEDETAVTPPPGTVACPMRFGAAPRAAECPPPAEPEADCEVAAVHEYYYSPGDVSHVHFDAQCRSSDGQSGRFATMVVRPGGSVREVFVGKSECAIAADGLTVSCDVRRPELPEGDFGFFTKFEEVGTGPEGNPTGDAWEVELFDSAGDSIATLQGTIPPPDSVG